MGILRLLVPDEIVCHRRILSTLHMIRFDSMPWPGRIETEKNIVSLHRIVHHSGQVCIAYPVPKYGELTLRTGTLPERDAPYSLPVELARGTCDRFRTQLGGWGDGGLIIPDRIIASSDQALESLVAAVMAHDDFAAQSEHAHNAIAFAVQGIFELCHEFALQVAKLRVDQPEPVTKLGVRVISGLAPPQVLQRLDATFQYFCVTDPYVATETDTPSRSATGELQMQVALEHRKIIYGPIWDAGKSGLPDQINQLVQFDAKRSAAKTHFVRALNQIQEPPDWLYAASGLNGIGHKFVSYPQQIQLVVDLLQIVEEFNRQVPVMLSFDFPWSERLAWSVGGSQGLQIADILLRQDVRVSGLGLEINLDYWPHGSLPRDPLQWLEMIDTWAQFGLPLFLFLRAATGDIVTATAGAETTTGIRGSFTHEQQTEFLKSVIEICLSRPYVHGLIWNDAQDDPHSPYRGSGLFTEVGAGKPILNLLIQSYRSLCR